MTEDLHQWKFENEVIVISPLFRILLTVYNSKALTSVQNPPPRAQRPASRVQRPETSAQSPVTSAQSPASRVQHPTLASRVQEFRYALQTQMLTV